MRTPIDFSLILDTQVYIKILSSGEKNQTLFTIQVTRIVRLVSIVF